MKWSSWIKWFAVYVGVFALLTGVFYAIRATSEIDPLKTEHGRTAIGFICAFLFVWCCRGLLLVSRGEAGRLSSFLQVSATTLLMLVATGGVYFAIVGLPILESKFGLVLLSFWGLAWFYILVIELLRLLLSRGGGVFGVAQAVLIEAIRMKVSISFLVILAVLVAGLPFTLNEDAPLRFRIQNYLQYSLMAVTVMLSLMTVILAAATMAFEIEKKQIFTVVTKPIGRGAHLLGKWIGLVLLNATLLTLSGLAVYGFTVFYLAKLDPKDFYDQRKLAAEVLTSRASVVGVPPATFAELASERVARIEKEDIERLLAVGQEVVRSQQVFDAPRALILEQGRYVLYAQMLEQVELEWRTLEPGQSTRFVFEGLQEAKSHPQAFLNSNNTVPCVQLRYKFITTGNLEEQEYQVPVEIRLNDRVLEYQTAKGDIVYPGLVAETVQTMLVPAEYIDDNGRLVIEILHVNPLNRFEPSTYTITFSSREPVEILYNSGGFTGNFIRGMLALFVKLAWTAMLGLVAATFLSFPVAMVFSCLILVAAMSTPYLLESYGMFGNRSGSLMDLFSYGLKQIGLGTSMLLQQYALYRSTPLIVDGREFSWLMLGRCALWVGVIWTAITGLLGWWIYRRRELARVQV